MKQNGNKSDPPPVDEEPEEGDRVIELINGVPHVSTHHEPSKNKELHKGE